MNNNFKRALSSILAFVMLCSCVCVMNVSSVLAAQSGGGDATWTMKTDSNISTYTYNKNDAPSVSSGDLTIYCASTSDTLSGDVFLFNGGGSISGRRFAISNCNEGDSIVITYATATSSSRNIVVYEGSTEKVSGDSLTVHNDSYATTETYRYSVKSNSTVSFYFNNNKVGVVSIQRTASTSTGSTNSTESSSTSTTEATTEATTTGSDENIETTTSVMTSSFDLTFDRNVTAGEDLGNGVYAVDAMTYSSDVKTFSTRKGYISNSTNPTDANGSSGGSMSYPVKGAALKFVVEADGEIEIDYVTTSSKSIYFQKVSGTTVTNLSTDATNGANTFKYEVKKGNVYYFYGQGTKARFYGVKFVADTKVTVSGTVTAANGEALPSKLYFTQSGTTTPVEADVVDGAYSVTLKNGKSYDVTCNEETLMVTDGATITVSESNTTHNVIIATAANETVTGTVYGLDDATKATITFTKAGVSTSATASADGTYSVSLQPGTYTVAVSSVDGYTVSSLSTADLVVKQSTDASAENWKNVLYTKAATAVTSSDVYVGKDKQFTTITDAMNAINASSLDSYTVHIDSGVYEEQVTVKANNVTFVAEGGDVTIQWYYGIGYIYYSADTTGYYSKEYAVDKHAKNSVSRWGTAVRVTGDNFRAEGISFVNTFNRTVTEAEKLDGVEASTSAYTDTKITLDRTADGFDPAAKASTERAAAIALDGAKAEFKDCKFLSSQDTLYTGTGLAYFTGCTIQGQTDYIFGSGGKAVFDNCQLVWAGYTSGSAAGYITAVQNQGYYLFRGCTISNATDVSGASVTAGFYGRPWQEGSHIIYVNTTVNNGCINTETADDYWNGWYNKPASRGSIATSYFYNVTASLTDNVWSVDSTEFASQGELTADDVTGATYLGTWVPVNYGVYDDIVKDGTTTYEFNYASAVSGLSQGDVMPASITDTNNAAFLTLTNIKYHGTSYGAYTGSTGAVSFTMDSAANSATLTISTSYQTNSGTATVYVNNEAKGTVDITTTDSSKNATATTTLTDLKAGDVVKVSFEGVSGSFYTKGITVTTDGTLKGADNIFAFEGVYSNGTSLYVVGKVAASDIEKADSVGFGAALSSEDTAKANKILDTEDVATSVAVSGTTIVSAGDDYYYAALELTEVEDDYSFIVIPFTTVNNVTAYGDVTTCTAANTKAIN